MWQSFCWVLWGNNFISIFNLINSILWGNNCKLFSFSHGIRSLSTLDLNVLKNVSNNFLTLEFTIEPAKFDKIDHQFFSYFITWSSIFWLFYHMKIVMWKQILQRNECSQFFLSVPLSFCPGDFLELYH